MGISVRGIVSFSALAVAVALAPPASGQGVPRPGQPTSPFGQAAPTVVVAPRSEAAPGRLVLEGALDPAEYVVGPGDVFTVSIGGSIGTQTSAVVSADGRLAIPQAGTFAAADRPLARVLAEVRQALSARYQNITTDATLSAPREFYVHVAGSVSQPGRHLVPAVARVEDGIAESSASRLAQFARYTTPVERASAPRWPALRNVTVTGRGGQSRSVDLMRYFATGDLGSNPYLRDGDALFVPAFDPLVEGVVVGGAVDRPGTYDIRPGDTVRDLLVVTTGADPALRVGRVRRVRPSAAGAPETREVSYAEAAQLDVRPRDQIYAVSGAPEADRVEIVGAVRYPGTYPITSGETTVEALVTMAGGLRDDALLRGTALERPVRDLSPPTPADDTAEDDRAATGAAPPPADDPRLVGPEAPLDAGLAGGISAQRFFARQTSRTPRVSIDPVQAVSGTAPVRLRGGDRLVVPFDDGLVRVYGRVQRSGYLPFAPGASAQDYVARAGGSSELAAATYVLDATTGGLTEGGGTVVQAGDAVFVSTLPSADTPELAQLALQERQDVRDDRQAEREVQQAEREDERDRRQARYQLIGTVLTVIGTAVSAIIAYGAITNQN